MVDNICGDLDFEDGGNPVVTNRVIAAADPVLCDTFVCKMLGYEVEEVPYIPLAEELGVGSSGSGSCQDHRAEHAKGAAGFIRAGTKDRCPGRCGGRSGFLQCLLWISDTGAGKVKTGRLLEKLDTRSASDRDTGNRPENWGLETVPGNLHTASKDVRLRKERFMLS